MKIIIIGMLLGCFFEDLIAQDPQFSQFYANPMYLNPAFVGSTQQTRVGANYRNQWPAIEANFVTYSAYFDHFISDINSGVGLLILHDKEGRVGLNTNLVGLQYSYQLSINDNLKFTPGTQIAFYNRNINFSNLTFLDQFNMNTGEIVGATNETLENLNKSFLDISFGGIFFTKNMWLGTNIAHLNTPVHSFAEDANPERLAMKFSYHGGLKISLKPGTIGGGIFTRPQERSLKPTFQYKAQGKFKQLDLGIYATFEPFTFGTWYRGIPLNQPKNVSNNDSFILLLGFIKKNKDDVFNIGYSYDYTLSSLGGNSGGAHEVSISYTWFSGNPRKPPKHILKIPCPDI